MAVSFHSWRNKLFLGVNQPTDNYLSWDSNPDHSGPGDHEREPFYKMALPLDGIAPSKVSPAFLHGNSTSHTWAFSAVAELIDNAYDPDVNASELWIHKRAINGYTCLTFVDNGNGMIPEKLHKMLSFGFCEKTQVNKIKPIGHYGNGFKSGSMRLGKDALVFTRTQTNMSIGFLSQTYLHDINAETVIVPIVSWSLPSKKRDNDTHTNNNLMAILKFSIFHSEAELLAELNSIEKLKTGTNIIVYNLKSDRSGKLELDFDSDTNDIRNPESHVIDLTTLNRPVHVVSPEYRRSLREYVSILYLKPRMKIILRGMKVKTKLLYKSLSQTEIDPYKPTWLTKPIRIIFGFTSSKEPESYGLNMYHKNRLIKAYEKIGCQKQANEQGQGVVGVVEVDFLQPIHNKQDFNMSDQYNAFMTNVSHKLNDYWNEKTYGRARPQQQQLPDWTWVQCDNCLKWRRLPAEVNNTRLPDKWFCRLSPDAAFNRCDIPEEPEDDDEALAQASYKKTFKKKEEEKRRQIKMEDQHKQQEKETMLREREILVSKRMTEIERQSEELGNEPVSSSQDRTQRKPTVADLDKARRALGIYKQQMEQKERTISELEREKRQHAQRQGELENISSRIQAGGMIAQSLTGGKANGSSSAVSSSSGAKSGKRRLEAPPSSSTKVFIKTEDGTTYTVERNTNVSDDAKSTVIDLTDEIDKDTDDVKPDVGALNHQLKSAKIFAHNCTQTVPVVVKFANQEEVKLSNLSAIERKQALLEKQRELTETNKSLKSLQKNICHLLKIIVPDFDYGDSDNIENIILDFIRVNGEEEEEDS